MPRSIEVRPEDLKDLQLLTVEELATLLRVNPWTVRRLIKTGQIPGVRLGGRLYVSRRAFEELFLTAGQKEEAKR